MRELKDQSHPGTPKHVGSRGEKIQIEKDKRGISFRFQARTAEQRWRSGRRETRDTLAIAALRESLIEQEHKHTYSDGRRGGRGGSITRISVALECASRLAHVAGYVEARLLITCYSMLYGSQRKLLELPRRSLLPQLARPAASCSSPDLASRSPFAALSSDADRGPGGVTVHRTDARDGNRDLVSPQVVRRGHHHSPPEIPNLSTSLQW